MSLNDIDPIAAINAEIEKAEAEWAAKAKGNPSLPSKPSSPSPALSGNPYQEDSLDANDGTDGNGGNILMPTFYSKVKDQLPPFLQKVADISDSEADADMLILGTLAAISACLPNIYAIYARRELFTNLYLFVTARAGSGKGRLSLCCAIVGPIHEELRAESNRLEEQFRQEKEQYKRQKKGDGIPEPTPPPIRQTEGDVLAASFGQDFGDFSQGLRQGFQNEPISYLRRTEREYVCIKQPRISTILSGTPQEVTNLMTSVENGLFSRFLFYCLDNPLVWLDVLDEGDGESLDDHFKALGSQFFAFYHSLQEERPYQDSPHGRARSGLLQAFRPAPGRILRHLRRRYHRFCPPPGREHLPHRHDPHRPPDDGGPQLLHPPLRLGR